MIVTGIDGTDEYQSAADAFAARSAAMDGECGTQHWTPREDWGRRAVAFKLMNLVSRGWHGPDFKWCVDAAARGLRAS